VLIFASPFPGNLPCFSPFLHWERLQEIAIAQAAPGRESEVVDFYSGLVA
jgi:hypothetical protein